MSDPQTPSQPGSAPGASPDPASSTTAPGVAPGAQPASGTKPAAPADTKPGTKADTKAGTKSGDKATSSKPAKADDPLRRSRAGGFYLAVIGLAVVLVLLIIFIVQNTEPTTVRFLSFEGDTPVAVALLAAAAAGMFLASIAASLRILQLRRRVKHDRKN